MKKTILFALFALSVTVGLSQQFVAPNVEWVNNLSFKNSRESVPSAVDQNGNVYTVGYVTQGGSKNSVLQKIDSAGTTLFVSTYNGPGNADDMGLGLALSDSGYIYICGESAGSGTGQDFFTIKYDASGTQLWVSRYNNSGSGNDIAVGLVVDSMGSVYTTGRSTNGSGNFDYKVIKYNHSGVQQWVYTYNGTASGDDRPRSIALSDSNRVYVTGYTTSTSVGKDITTIRINTSTGSADWVKTINGASNTNEEGNAVIMDGYDPVIVGGIVNTGSNLNYYTAKLNRVNGNILWSQTYDGHGNSDEAYSIARTDSGWFAVTGLAVNAGNYEYHTLLYNNGGTLLSTNKYATNITTPTVTPKVAIDTIANHIYVVGETNNGTANVDVVAYQITPSGNFGWIKTYNGAGNAKDVGVDLAVNAWGQIFLCAQTGNATGDVDITTIRISQTPVYLPVDTANYPGDRNHIFWQNKGQIFNTDTVPADSVLYYSMDAAPIEYIRKNAISFVNERLDTLVATEDSLERIDMTFDEINPYAEIFAYDETDYYRNYLLGGMVAPVTNLYGHRHLFAPNYYHGIDLHYYSDSNGVKIVFVVRPGYDPLMIKQIFTGQQGTAINGSGELEVYGLLDTLVFNPPNMFNVAYPPLTTIPAYGGSGWMNITGDEYKFDVGTYYNALPLVIEITQKSIYTPCSLSPASPVNCDWSTYIGGQQEDNIIDVENNGSTTYVYGSNLGGNYPISVGQFISNTNTTGGSRLVLTRFKSNDDLEWSTYYGSTSTGCTGLGSGIGNIPRDMDVDRKGFAYIVGVTTATNGTNMYFPTPTSGQYYNATNNGYNCSIAFIAKIDTTGMFVRWGTFVGDSADGPVLAYIDLNNAGTEFVTGGSDNFGGNGTLGLIASNAHAFFDTSGTGLIMRFSTNGVIQHGTRIGSSGFHINGVQFNSANEYYATSTAFSAGLPPLKKKVGAYYDSTFNGLNDVYLAKFNAQDSLVWGTYVGGWGIEYGQEIKISNHDELALLGTVTNNVSGFPFVTPTGSWAGTNMPGIFLTKFSSADSMIYSVTCTGPGTAGGLAYDNHDYLYLNGYLSSTTYGFTTSSMTGFYYQALPEQLSEGILMGFTPQNSRMVSTYFGGKGCWAGFGDHSAEDWPARLSVNSNNDLYMAGSTDSDTDFPLYNPTGAAYFDNVSATGTYGQSWEGFVSKFSLASLAIGIDENKVANNSEIVIFPNPTEGLVNLILKGDYEKIVNLNVYDIAGRIVKTEVFIKNGLVDQKVVNLSELSNGIYFLNVRMGNKTYSNKVIISK